MKKNFLVATVVSVSLMSVSLTGCFPALVVGAGTAAGAALGRDSRTLQTITDDTNIQFQGSQAIAADPKTSQGTSITVTSFNKVVLLTGEVPSEGVRAAAEVDVQKIPKVRRVYNLIRVAPQIGIIQLGDDARISANIKARMMVTSDLNSDNFKYVVNDRVVYLMGLASHAQAKLALDVIRNSTGVTKVVNLVEYTDTESGAVPSMTSAAPASSTPVNAASSTPTPTSAPVSQQAAAGTAKFVPTTTT